MVHKGQGSWRVRQSWGQRALVSESGGAIGPGAMRGGVLWGSGAIGFHETDKCDFVDPLCLKK